MGKRILPGMSHKLNTLCDHYGISLDHHRADSDSRAAAKILIQYMETGAVVTDYIKQYKF
jgi:DNA polymerase-3 subunit epsilon